MGIVGRTRVSAGSMMAGALIGTFWLYFWPSAESMADQWAGPFQSQINLIEWAIPTSAVILMLAGGLYLLYGGVREERATQQRRVR